ncbi:dormancy-associated protein homolog 3 [Oryza brachyantha]|uniref:dormancy-associated protein homolog 3 n=1 Tax=Oryza brachyantha TaxID=4533 RepID=UPI001ADB4C18|nr:dormancy-associated protein homolog 3 [Oryza brachyantha]
MGLLDQLWDETVAGPLPDSGLGKLRKYSSFSPSSSSPAAAAAAAAEAPASSVTRSITIVRPPSLSVPSPRGGEHSSSVPSSPASAPDSPFASATTPKGDSWRRLRRKPRTADAAVPEAAATVGPRSPTVYDWVVISSLDR